MSCARKSPRQRHPKLFRRPRRGLVAALGIAATVVLVGLPLPGGGTGPAPVRAISGLLVTSQLGYAPGDPIRAVLAVASGTVVTRTYQVVDAANPATVG